MRLSSQVIITNNTDKTLLELEALQTTERIIKIAEEERSFSVDDAKQAIEKAYMASEETTVIILVAKIFSPIVQNKLLKVIEEPPDKKEFILITQSKATILDTIRSRLPLTILTDKQEIEALGLDIEQLSLSLVYEFIQAHKRTNAKEMTGIIEHIVKKVLHSEKYNVDEKTLTLFSNAYVALDMGSPPQFVLNALLLKLLARKKR